jgi:hypothetical protein
MRAIDRRTFFARGAALGLGAAAWACSHGGKKSSPGDNAISVEVTAQVGLAAGDTRNAVAVFRGQNPIVPKSLRTRLVPPNGQPFEVTTQHERVSFGSGGSEPSTQVADIFVFHHQFDPGIWQVQAIVDGKPAAAVFQIDAKSQSPLVGGKAIASESPTVSNPRGVNPICTRTPACSMHDLTIADALASSKPLVAIFATPRFCTSRTCGPSVDLVEAQKKRVGTKANWVHVEVYRNAQVALTENGDSPTFAQWHLATEPWTYFIGPDGVIKDRWLGAMGTDELGGRVDALVAGH